MSSDYYDLGFQMGQTFKKDVRTIIDKSLRKLAQIGVKISSKSESVELIKEIFPQYYSQLEGYSDGANLDIQQILMLFFYNNILNSNDTDSNNEKCTTLLANGGSLLAHCEDGALKTPTEICLVKTQIKGITKFEVFYYGFIGGNAVGYNQGGFVYTINSLYSNVNNQNGILKDIVARYLTDASDFDDILKRIDFVSKYKRLGEYNYNFIDKSGRVMNVESTESDFDITFPKTPFVHTNHYLGKLRRYEAIDKYRVFPHRSKREVDSFNRYNYAVQNLKEQMSVEKLKELCSEHESKSCSDLYNYYTDAAVIADVAKRKFIVKLVREKNKGWIEYNINWD